MRPLSNRRRRLAFEHSGSLGDLSWCRPPQNLEFGRRWATKQRTLACHIILCLWQLESRDHDTDISVRASLVWGRICTDRNRRAATDLRSRGLIVAVLVGHHIPG